MPTIEKGLRPPSTAPIPQSQYITIQALADRLSATPGKIHALISSGYLRSLSKTEVALPPASVMDWLKGMVAPIEMRPLITMGELGDLASMTIDDVRKLCVSYSIPISVDPCFGDMVSLSGALAFFKNLSIYSESAHFDRAHLLLWMMGIGKDKLNKSPIPYDQRLEMEIARIAKLREPERTMRAVELLGRFTDAQTLAQSVIAMPNRVGKLEGKLRRIAGVPASVHQIPKGAGVGSDSLR